MGSIASPDPETVSRLEAATVVFANCFAFTQEVKDDMLQVRFCVIFVHFTDHSSFIVR